MMDMLEQLRRAKATIDGEDDNLLQAIAIMAASRHITVIPQDNKLTIKPVILLPQRMYDRLLSIIPANPEQSDD